LFYVLAGVALLKPRRAFGAGLVLALNAFVKLPNVAGLALLVFSPRKGASLLGALAGFALAFGAMAALGHLHLYLDGVRGLFAAPDDPHGLGKAIFTISVHQALALAYGAAL